MLCRDPEHVANRMNVNTLTSGRRLDQRSDSWINPGLLATEVPTDFTAVDDVQENSNSNRTKDIYPESGL